MSAPATAGTAMRPAGFRALLAAVARGQMRRLTVAVVLTCAQQSLEVLVPVLVGYAVQAVVDSRGALPLVVALLGVIAVMGMRALCHRFGYRAAQGVMVASGEGLRHEVIKGTLVRSARGETTAAPGVVASVVNIDTFRVSVAGIALPRLFSTALALVVVCGYLVSITPLLGAVTVVAGLVAFGVLSLAARRVSTAARTERIPGTAETSFAEDVCRGMRVLRGIGAADAVGTHYRSMSERTRQAAERLAGVEAAHRGLSVAVGGAVVAVGTASGAWFVSRGEANLGEFVASLGLLQFVQGSMAGLGWALSMCSQARASLTTVTEMIGEAPVTPRALTAGTAPAPVAAVEVSFEAVALGATTGLYTCLRPGDVVGLVATDRTTAGELAECIEGRRSLRAGRITVGGADPGGRPPPFCRAPGTGWVAVVDGEAGLLADTFTEDLDLLSFSRETVDDAIAATLTADVLAGLGTRSEHAGAQTAQVVSGGELQRLALLRALVARPAVLVMRDATTALDPATEQHVMRSLVDLRVGQVTLLLTTSPIALSATTRVLLLDEKRPPIESSHGDLLRNDARYREIVWGGR